MRAALLALIVAVGSHGAERMDLAPFARPCCSQDVHRLHTTFDYTHPSGLLRATDGRGIYGLQWAEERDLFEVAVRFKKEYEARKASLEYWFLNWLYSPPRMPTIEDPVDDPWQGQWVTAATEVTCRERTCRFAFLPLKPAENRRAENLPDVSYRRALRFRLVFPAGDLPEIESVKVFSESLVKPIALRVRLNLDRKPATGAPAKSEFRAYNGWVREVKQTEDGAVVTVDAADPRPAGSNDATVVEVSDGKESFSFCPSDVEKGPIYIPDFQAYITLASDRKPFSRDIVKPGGRIRERLAKEPEQTYERASREIPALDPVERQGDRLYLPLAADANWQKFAFE